VLVVALVLACLAALLHVYVFWLESVRFVHPATMRVFGIRSAADAETMRPWAFNQGFYNLFLALGAFIGVGCVVWGAEGSAQAVAGWTLIFSCCGSMLLAAVVLALTGRKYLRAAAAQGTAPLLAVVLGIIALAV